jgi:hypothetical protein
MEHNRPVTEQDRESLALVNRCAGSIVLTPVFLNGVPRQALAIVLQNEGGIYLRLLGVLLDSNDLTLDKLGNPASFTPPAGKEAIN